MTGSHVTAADVHRGGDIVAITDGDCLRHLCDGDRRRCDLATCFDGEDCRAIFQTADEQPFAEFDDPCRSDRNFDRVREVAEPGFVVHPCNDELPHIARAVEYDGVRRDLQRKRLPDPFFASVRIRWRCRI